MKRRFTVGVGLAVLLTISRHAPAQASQLPEGTVAALADAASQRYDLGEGSADRLVCLAWRESSFRADVTAGPYMGLLQEDSLFWSTYGQEGQSPYDPYYAMDAAAHAIAVTGRWSHWSPAVRGLC